MIEPLSLLTALLLGLFGASHCLVMCGGIAAGIGQTAKASQHSAWQSAMAFNLGRISSYTLAGLLVGALGLWLQSQHHILMLSLRTLSRLLLILMGLYITRWLMWLTRLEALGQHVWRHIQPKAGRLLTEHHFIKRMQLGMLWGFLPCGLIYSTLGWVAANGDPMLGAVCMLCFGLGTFPAMFSATLAGGLLRTFLQNRLTKLISGLLLIGFGGWTLYSVWW